MYSKILYLNRLICISLCLHGFSAPAVVWPASLHCLAAAWLYIDCLVQNFDCSAMCMSSLLCSFSAASITSSQFNLFQGDGNQLKPLILFLLLFHASTAHLYVSAVLDLECGS